MRSVDLQRLFDEDWMASGRIFASPSGTYDLELQPETFPNVLYWTTSIVENKPTISVEESREFGVHYGLHGIELSVPTSRINDAESTANILARYAIRRGMTCNSYDDIMGRSVGRGGDQTAIEGIETTEEIIIDDVETGRDHLAQRGILPSISFGIPDESHATQDPTTDDPNFDFDMNMPAGSSGYHEGEEDLEALDTASVDWNRPANSHGLSAPVLTTAPRQLTAPPIGGPSSTHVNGEYVLEDLERCTPCRNKDVECLWDGARCKECRLSRRTCDITNRRAMVDSSDLRLIEKSLSRIRRIAKEHHLDEIVDKAESIQRDRATFEFRNHGMRVLSRPAQPYTIESESDSDWEDVGLKSALYTKAEREALGL